MRKNSILGINYTAPNDYRLLEVSPRDVPANSKAGDRVMVPQRLISQRVLTNDKIRKLVSGSYVVQAPHGRGTMLVVDLLPHE